MSEITEAMDMLEDLPESTQDGQQEADEAAATTLQEEAAETAQEATESESKASLPFHRYAVEALSMVELGRQGEGKARRIEIDVSSWLATLPGAHFEIVAVRPGETESYLPEGVTLEGSVLCWMPTRDDTAKDGYGRGEVRATLGDSCCKSPVFRTRIEAAIESSGSTPTEPPAWVQQILGSVSAAQEAAQTAQQQATEASSSAQEAAASVSGLRGWSLTEETDGTVTIDHAAAQSTAETTD